MSGNVPIMLPRVTMAAHEGTFMEWLVEDGTVVDEGQPIYLVATDKVENEVAAPVAGVLRHGVVEVETTYDVGTELGHIETS